MYVLIMDDGVMGTMKKLTDDEYSACKVGIVTLLDVTNPENVLDFDPKNGWVALTKFDE